MNDRRNFLKHISAATLAASAMPKMLTWALPQSQSIEVPGEDGMILRSFRFVDLEAPVEYFNTWLTPGAPFLRAQPHVRAGRARCRRLASLHRRRSRKAHHPNPRRTHQTRDPLRSQHSRMRRQRTQPPSSSSPRHSMGQRCGEYRPLLRPTSARRLQRAG